MITLSLDEYGKFESLTEKESEPTFIAGVIYDDQNNKSDTDNERRRIEAYYKAVINEASHGNNGFSFPESLHSVGSKTGDHSIVRPVKETVSKTLAEFLRNGSFRGAELLGKSQQRRGKYYIYAILKSDAGMTQLMSDSVNFLVKDGYASNLYFHMASTVVSRMIFHNPVIDNIREVSLDIATRKSEDLDQTSERATEYRRQGYNATASTKSNDNKVFFGISNADIYRVAISDEMMHSGKTAININTFRVKPINYHQNKNMEFLYLADSICSILGRNLKSGSADQWLGKLQSRASQLVKTEQAIIIAYDEIDIIYQNAWQRYEERDYYNALKICYNARLKEGIFAKFYQDLWFKRIEDRIVADSTPSRFIDSVNRIHETLTTNDLDQERTISLYQSLERMIPAVEPKLTSVDSQYSLYKLYDIGVSAFCHIGDSVNAIKCFKKCKRYAFRVPVDYYLTTINRIIVTLLDNFENSKALSIAKENVEYSKLILDLKNEFPLYDEIKEESSLSLCKSYSQLAQVYAFRRDSKSVDLFKMALAELPKSSVDYKITLSYLLHYYLDAGDSIAYEDLATEYFGGEKTPKKRFEYIMVEAFKNNPVINYKYSLYVYMKGAFLFESDQLSDALLDSFYKIEETIKKYERKARGKKNASFEKLTGHPSELIFKYIALLAHSKNNEVAFRDNIEHIERCLSYTGMTIDAICLFAKAEIYELTHDLIKRDTFSEALSAHMKANFPAFSKVDFSDNGDDRYHELSEIITYMYR